ncbi:MAG: hypothetical protein IJW64_01350 [Clostridia bacterium]|nr:hypothetical protein [Clostridia bacterium]
MKDFNSFKSGENSGESQDLNFSGDPFETFAKLSAKYEGKSSDDIMRAIIYQAEKSRKAGKLSDKDIDNFASSVAPLLNDKQRKTLYLVVDKLKQIK